LIITANYEQWHDDKGRLHIRSNEVTKCSDCGGELKVRDSKERKVIFPGSSEKTKLVIRRMLCKSCETLHIELPDMVLPYKRHACETVEAVIKEEENPL
jgi:ssDNA-binding Zn-finger/Zn-ribbon topoisomerase 1